jgi:hypothetical protein
MVFCFQNDSKYIVTKKKYFFFDSEGVEFAKKNACCSDLIHWNNYISNWKK